MSNYYTVEEVIGRRKKKGKYEYLIKWKDYSINESTWEPMDNLYFVKELIEEYDRSYDSKNKNKKKKEGVDEIVKPRKNITNTQPAENKNNFPFYMVDKSIFKIDGIRDEKGVLYAFVEIKQDDGTIQREKLEIDELKMNNPWLLIDYYESRAKFI